MQGRVTPALNVCDLPCRIMDVGAEIQSEAGRQDTVFALIKAQQAQIAAQTKKSRDVAEVSNSSDAATRSGATATTTALSPEAQKVVDDLRARDREVRDHEQAHKRVGGAFASEPTYTYQTGPDGKRYAVGGEVRIDASPVADNPEATIQKMEIVKAAALAPAEPSSADRKVAAQADATRNQAQADLNEKRAAERRGDSVDTRV